VDIEWMICPVSAVPKQDIRTYGLSGTQYGLHKRCHNAHNQPIKAYTRYELAESTNTCQDKVVELLEAVQKPDPH